MLRILTSTLILLTLAICIQAQTTNTKAAEIIVIYTKDGSTFTGKLVESNQQQITIETESLGQLTIEKSKIESINSPGDSSNPFSSTSAFDHPGNEQATRYFVTSSGFNLKKGEMYFENIAVFFNSFGFGITDKFSLIVGGELASLLFDQEFPILYIAPKFSLLQSDQTNISIIANYFDSPGSYFDGVLSLQSAFTFGDRKTNFTIGPGIGYNVDNLLSDDLVVPFNISFSFALSKRVSLVSDNIFAFFDSDVEGVYSMGVRIHFRNGAALNASLWRITEDTDNILALPFISGIIPFGK